MTRKPKGGTPVQGGCSAQNPLLEGASGYVNGSPYWGVRLPWLEGVALCHEQGVLHDPFRDALTDYCYCRTCGFSFGMV